jgi:hypothetical protein
MSAPERPRRIGDALAVLGVALAARLAVVAWAAARFPPAADGSFYHTIAQRIAAGLGYTWLWPDGAVTYAAHYPVGYPALVGAAYAIFGPRPAAAMGVNAVLGALAALAAHRLAHRAAEGPRARGVALAAGLLVALHPGLVAYTPALMTEGVTAALVACAAALAARARETASAGTRPAIAGGAAVGVVIGLATLVRPQSLVLAPAFGLLAAIGLPRRSVVAVAGAASLAAVLVCLPWTARNCARMERCALVSVNGGWNLLIGADAASTGAWSPIKVPDACREVWGEADKDACFGRAAQRWIGEHPAAWIALAPRKLAATFDYAGAAPWYLHEASPAAFPDTAKEALGAAETVYERALLLLSLAWAARRTQDPDPPARRWARAGVAAAGGAFVLTLHAWIAYAAFAAACLLRGRALAGAHVLGGATAVVVLATMATHAVFFGAGRYSMVVFPLVSALAPLAFERRVTS